MTRILESLAGAANRAAFYFGLFVVGPCYGVARFLYRTARRAGQAFRWWLL